MAAGAEDGDSQQLVSAFGEQHDRLTETAGTAARRLSATITAGSTRLAFAQAMSSAGVLQQQFEKHCSAVAQPQGLSMQGNGRERSLPASRLAAGELEAAGDAAPIGNGNPEATSA